MNSQEVKSDLKDVYLGMLAGKTNIREASATLSTIYHRMMGTVCMDIVSENCIGMRTMEDHISNHSKTEDWM